MKITICKCKGRKKANKQWHDCDQLFVKPFETKCPNGCARQFHLVREFETFAPYSEVDNNQNQ